MWKAGLALFALAGVPALGQGNAADTARVSADAPLVEQLHQLKGDLNQQQALILQQQERIAQQQAKLDALEKRLSEVSRQESAPAASSQTTTAAEVKKDTAPERPSTILFRGVSLTPGGFIEADTITRARNENADVVGNFSAVPFDGTANANLTEFRATARASRMSLLVEGKAGPAKWSGYYEVDFLGQAPTANQVQTNSFTPRQRQLWAQAEFNNGLVFTAGQQWSLITTNRKGIAVRGEYIPCTIEGAYVIGFNYVRQTAFRVTKKLSDKHWLAFELANPETAQPNASYVPPNLLGFNNSTNASSPNGGTLNYSWGITNGFSTNLAPDLLAKVAWEPGWGHYEVKALGRFFRDRLDGHTNVTYGGGVGVAAILPLLNKRAEYIVEAMAGSGIGRYGAAVGPDVTLRPDGAIIPLRAVHFLTGIELHPRPSVDLYFYGGNEYYGRAPYLNPSNSGQPAGYGSALVNNTNCGLEVLPSGAASCGAQNKDVYEFTAGFWRRLYKGPAGAFQYGMQYEYLRREAWAGIGGAPQGNNHLGLTSIRYYLP